MKKHLMILMAVAGFAVSGFGQGQVTIANNASSLIRHLDPVAGTPIAAGSAFSFQLFAGPQGSSADSLTPVVPITGVNAVAAGRIANQIVTVAQVLPGSTATFQIRAWESTYVSYEAAFLAGGTVGLSALFDSLTSATGNPTPLPVTLAGKYAGFAVAPIPEPSTIALGLLGAGSLLFLRRKK